MQRACNRGAPRWSRRNSAGRRVGLDGSSVGRRHYSAQLMPVPLPSAQDVNLERPDAAEAQSMIDAVSSVVAGRDGLLPLQQRLLVAHFSAMTEHVVTLDG